MSNIVAERTIGYRTLAGVVYALTDFVTKEGGKYVATHGLRSGGGVPIWSKSYKSKSAALKKLGLEDGECTRMLAADWEATFVHGVTGQDCEDQTLSAGVLMRDVQSARNEEMGRDEHTALVSSDGGRTWYRYRSFAAPFVR